MSVAAPARPRHIVIVDDEVAAREMFGEYLASQGYAITLCDGGHAVRDVLATGTVVDLVLLDLNMPEEDGLSIIRFLKQTTVAAVILLTATASSIDRVVGLEMGADDYLTKPCELRELLARIRAVLRRVHWSKTWSDERRLAAIVSFDQVGFTRAIQNDETKTLAAIERVFAEVVEPSLKRHRGILFKKLGDGALAEFSSVVDAIEWSVAFQTAVCDMAMPRQAAESFRLGMAIGDIVIAQAIVWVRGSRSRSASKRWRGRER